jgi:hypothetical protein
LANEFPVSGSKKLSELEHLVHAELF